MDTDGHGFFQSSSRSFSSSSSIALFEDEDDYEDEDESPLNTSFSAATALASCALVMVSGGVKLMTLPYSPSGRKINPRCKSVLIAAKSFGGGGRAVVTAQFHAGHQAEAAHGDLEFSDSEFSIAIRRAETSPSSAARSGSFSLSISAICASAIAQPTGWPRNVLV